jgi:hypothetical protein
VAWEYSTAGLLWRLLPSPGGVFVLEDRNIDAKTVTFAGLDMLSGAVLWKNVAVEERWWVSIERVEGDMVILHGYGTPDMPDHRKMYVLGLRTGVLLWQNTELALLFVDGPRVYAARDEFEGRRYFELALDSGTVIRELPEDELDAIREASAAPPEELAEFPQPCGDLRDLDEDLRRLVGSMAAAHASPGLIELLRKREFEAVAVHLNTSADPARPSFTQRLTVRRSGATVFEDAMNTGAAVSAPDGFFTVDDMLYYIKDQRILRALPLHGS